MGVSEPAGSGSGSPLRPDRVPVLRRFVAHLCDHPVLAGLIAALFYTSGLFTLLAAPVFVIVTLQGGLRRGLPALASSVVALLILTLAFPHSGPGLAVLAFAFLGLVFVLASELLRRGKSLALIVSLAALLLLAALAIYAFSVPHPLSLFEHTLRTALQHEEALFAHRYPTEAHELEHSLKTLTPLYPYLLGIFGLYAVLVFAVDLFIGAAVHAAAYSPGSFGRHFRAFRVGKTLAFLTLALFLVTFVVRSPLLSDAFLPLLPLYLFQGLSVVHARLYAHPAARPLLFLLYALLVFALLAGGVFVYLALALVLLGWIDNFLVLTRPGGPSSPARAGPPASPSARS